MEAPTGASQPATPQAPRASFGAGALTLTPARSGRHSRGASMDLRAAAAALALPRQDSAAGSGSGPGPGLGSALSSPVPGRTPRHSRTRSIEAAAALAGEPARQAYRAAVIYGAQQGAAHASQTCMALACSSRGHFARWSGESCTGVFHIYSVPWHTICLRKPAERGAERGGDCSCRGGELMQIHDPQGSRRRARMS